MNTGILAIVGLLATASAQAGDLKAFDAKKWEEKKADVAKEFVDVTKGGMFGDGKKIAIPECTVGFQASIQGSALSNAFSNKGIQSNMVVYPPFNGNEAEFQAIADKVCDRLKAKLVALGYEVIGPKELAAQERYAEAFKEEFQQTPYNKEGRWIYFGGKEYGTPKGDPTITNKSTWWKLNRDVKAIVIAPRFNLTFGNVKGGGSSATDSNGLTTASATTKYAGELKVSKDSRIETAYEFNFGNLQLDEEFGIADATFIKDVTQTDSKTNALSVVGNLALGSRVEKTSYWEMSFDFPAFKEAALAQLEIAENLFVERINVEKND